MIVTGTDQTWVDGPNFGLTGNGVLFRECLADAACQPLYIAALRQIAANKKVVGLATTARAIRAVIAPWRARDPRREQSVADRRGRRSRQDRLHGRPPGGARAGGSGTAHPPHRAGLRPSSMRPLLGKPVAVPATPVAGKQFTFSLPVTRSDTGALLKTGELVGTPSVGGTSIRHADSFKNGTGTALVRRPEDGEGQAPESQDRGHGSGSDGPRHLHVYGSLIPDPAAPRGRRVRLVREDML